MTRNLGSRVNGKISRLNSKSNKESLFFPDFSPFFVSCGRTYCTYLSFLTLTPGLYHSVRRLTDGPWKYTKLDPSGLPIEPISLLLNDLSREINPSFSLRP